METPPNFEKMDKLPAPCRFFDVNALWYFPNRWVVRALYPLPVSANQITLLALWMGLASAGFYAFGGEQAFIFGAMFLYGKLFLDNVDGPLARLRGEVSRLGRFLDSFSGFVFRFHGRGGGVRRHHLAAGTGFTGPGLPLGARSFSFVERVTAMQLLGVLLRAIHFKSGRV